MDFQSLVVIVSMCLAAIGLFTNGLIIYVYRKYARIRDLAPMVALLPLAVVDWLRCASELQV